MKHKQALRIAGMVLIVGAMAFVFGSAGVRAEIVDAIVATVGDEAILRSELVDVIALDLRQARLQGAGDAELGKETDTLMAQALEQAVEAKIMVRQALLEGLEVSNDDVEQAMDQIKKPFSSEDEFLSYLAQADQTVSEVRELQRKQLLALRMSATKRAQFEKEVAVSEAEVAQYYQDHKQEFARPERALVRSIALYAKSKTPERASAKARLEALREEIDAGADFEELAKAHSEAPGADQGGEIGWVMRGDLQENLEAAAFGLPEGGVSDVLENEDAVILLKVDRKEGPGEASLDEARKEIEPLLRQNAARDRYDKWMAELRKRSRVRLFQ